MFLFFQGFQPGCSYKRCSYIKKKVYFDLEVVFLDPRLDSHECSPCELGISGPLSPPVLPDNFVYWILLYVTALLYWFSVLEIKRSKTLNETSPSALFFSDFFSFWDWLSLFVHSPLSMLFGSLLRSLSLFWQKFLSWPLSFLPFNPFCSFPFFCCCCLLMSLAQLLYPFDLPPFTSFFLSLYLRSRLRVILNVNP